MSKQLAKQDKTLRGWLQSDIFKNSVAQALPAHLSSEKFQRIALTALQRTPKLASCTQESVFQCLLDLGSYGLLPDGRSAHLIPYGKTCTLILDYKGMIDLVLRNSDYTKVCAELVCENDEFVYELGEVTTHKIDFKEPRGEPYCCYAFVQMKDGTRDFEVLHRDYIDKVKKASRSGASGPWKDWPESMWKKTAIRALCKRLRLSPELNQLMALDDDQFDFGPGRQVKVAQPVFDDENNFLEEAASTTTAENTKNDMFGEEDNG